MTKTNTEAHKEKKKEEEMNKLEESPPPPQQDEGKGTKGDTVSLLSVYFSSFLSLKFLI